MQGHGRRVVLQKDAWLHALQALAADESAAAHAPQPQASGKSHTHAGDALPAAALQQVSMDLLLVPPQAIWRNLWTRL